MREILFRAKCIDNGEWVYGVPIKKALAGSHDGYYPTIIPECDGRHQTIYSTEIKEETVGQYTGLTDKNGTKIFEGDIVQYELHDIRNTAVIKYGAPKEDSFCYGWYLDDNNGNTAFLFCKNWIKDYNCQVIGNIFDNPELLEGKK